MVRFIPGIIAAIAAFLAMKLLAWALSLTAQLVIFFGVYIVVILVVDAALKRFNNS